MNGLNTLGKILLPFPFSPFFIIPSFPSLPLSPPSLTRYVNNNSFSEKLATLLKESFEATTLEDIAYVYDDADMLKEVEKTCSRLEYKKFLDVRKRTTRIAPPPAPDSSVTMSSASSSVIVGGGGGMPIPVPPPVAGASYVFPPEPPIIPGGYPSAAPIVPGMAGAVPAPGYVPAGTSAHAAAAAVPHISTVDRDIEAKKRELMEIERRLFEEKEKHRKAAEKTRAIEKKKMMIKCKSRQC